MLDLMRSTAEQSFDETSKIAYTHGLEAIYELKNVDVKTVRPMGGQHIEDRKDPVFILGGWQQLWLDLGEGFRQFVPPLFIEEPLQALGLPAIIEKNMRSRGIKTVGEVLEGAPFKEMAATSHAEEIRRALSIFLEGRFFLQSTAFDIRSLIRQLIKELDEKSACAFLYANEMEELGGFSKQYLKEIAAYPVDKLKEAAKQAAGALKRSSLQSWVREQMAKIMNSLVKPWLMHRGGVGSGKELLERLKQVATEPECTEQVISLFENLFYDQAIFSDCFVELEEGLYAVDIGSASDFHRVRQLALSYFYAKDASFSYRYLHSSLEREFIAGWEAITPSFIRSTLLLSNCFDLYKNRRHELIISLRWEHASQVSQGISPIGQ